MTQSPFETDTIRAFQFDNQNVRGRVIKLSESITEIVSAHAYHPLIAHILAEALTLTATLASFLKYEGIFTLQTSGDGILKMLVCDMTSEGHLRGYAQYNDNKLQRAIDETNLPRTVQDFFGKGYLAFTVDQGKDTERYQGIVPLEQETLAGCVEAYFTQSEQIACAITLVVQATPTTHKQATPWQSMCLILQKMPDVAPISAIKLHQGESNEEAWQRLLLLLQTCKNEELLDKTLASETLLYRLFHEDTVRIFPAQDVIAKCRCSREKILFVLVGVSPSEREAIKEDGVISATCQFCSTLYTFADDDFESVGTTQ